MHIGNRVGEVKSLQISNVSAPLANTIAPFTPKVEQPSSGVTKDVLVSTFSPVTETNNLASSQNRLQQNAIVYSPESIAKSAVTTPPAVKIDDPVSERTIQDEGQADEGESAPESGGRQTVQPNGNDQEEEAPVNEGAADTEGEENQVSPSGGQPSDETTDTQSSSAGLEPEELEVVAELSARDREVRAHEQQHQAVGGQFAGAASFSYQTGPDGVQYAVGGEVSIDISAVPNNPQATIEKMRTVRSAALAPVEPSAQDRSVAAAATRIMLQAQSELASENAEQRQIEAQEAQETRKQAAEAQEQQQEEAENRRSTVSEGVRAYEDLIELGQRFENGLVPDINLDEVV